jgi:hypothetical protein
MKEYNGWSSWNEWNVVLWLSNDYGIEQMMRLWTDKGYSKVRINKALREDLLGTKTPDGALINKKGINSYIKHWG